MRPFVLSGNIWIVANGTFWDPASRPKLAVVLFSFELLKKRKEPKEKSAAVSYFNSH